MGAKIPAQAAPLSVSRHRPAWPLARLMLWAVIAWFALFPFLPLPAFWVTLGSYIGLYALVTLGLVLLTGMAGLISFGQAAFVGLGAYTTAYLSTALGLSPWLGLPAGLLLTGGASVVLGAFTLRLSGHYLPLATLAWSLSLYYLFGNQAFLGGHDGITGIPALSALGVDFSDPRMMFLLIWLWVGAAAWGLSNLLDSRPGRAIQALSQDEKMPESMGIDTARYKMIAFVSAALLASLSGWLYAHLQRSVSPTPFGSGAGIEYLFMAVVGGISSLAGAVVGATLFTGLKHVLQDILPALLGRSGNYELLVFGLLVLVLLQRGPKGLWPWVQGLLARVSARGAAASQALVEETPAEAAAAEQALRRRALPQRGGKLLEVRDVSKSFGGLQAVNGLQFDVFAGEILGLIGPNGAGKSTLFDLLTGVTPLSQGSISFLGQRIDGLQSRLILERGIARTFQHVHLVPELSVLDNVAIGAHRRGGGGALRAALRLDRAEEKRLLHLAARQIRRVGLGPYMHVPAGSLALGQQRVVEIARALCSDPILLILDEPAAGLRLLEKRVLKELLAQLKQDGVSVVLVEHDMDFVMDLADRLVVMEFGSKIAEGAPGEVQKNEKVLAAYLGGLE